MLRYEHHVIALLPFWFSLNGFVYSFVNLRALFSYIRKTYIIKEIAFLINAKKRFSIYAKFGVWYLFKLLFLPRS